VKADLALSLAPPVGRLAILVAIARTAQLDRILFQPSWPFFRPGLRFRRQGGHHLAYFSTWATAIVVARFLSHGGG
jgi:hypothetical protein